MIGLTELERELIEALKTAHVHIANDAMRMNIGNIIARAEAKAKEPQCVCDVDKDYKHFSCGKPYYNPHGSDTYCFNSAQDGRYCSHDRACHAPKDGE